MAHYYAFCKVHKKCGPNRSDINDAWDDCEKHENEVSEPHRKVFPKLSSRESINGSYKYKYKVFYSRED